MDQKVVSFVNFSRKEKKHIWKLKLMCRYVKPNVLYSDVLKTSQLLVMGKQSNKIFDKCFDKTPDHETFGKGKSVELYSSSIKSPKKSSMRRGMLKRSMCSTHVS